MIRTIVTIFNIRIYVMLNRLTPNTARPSTSFPTKSTISIIAIKIS